MFESGHHDHPGLWLAGRSGRYPPGRDTGEGQRVGIREGVRTAAIGATLLAACAANAAAQAAGAGGMEVLGVRAQGMGGAFVAVADDATAVYWNPAGLPSGDLVSLAMERSHVSLPSAGGDAPALRTGAVLIGTPPLAAGYYRLGSTHVVPVAVVQSIGEYVDVGGAVKAVWGEGIDGRTHAGVDADLGVMVRTQAWRVGLVLRNLAGPSFGPEVIAFGGTRYRLERHARVGVALFPREGLTLAVDADLTSLDQRAGSGALEDARRRAIAIGAEQQVSPRVVVRGGVRAQTIDGARPSASGGASLLLRPSIWADVQATGGGDRSDRSWTVGLSFRY
jgi:hypothetical protein